MVDRAPIAYRNRVTIHRDARAEGATQPDYSDEIVSGAFAEVRQVSGGEVIRGRTVEAITSFVVSMRYIPSIVIDADCQVTVDTGTHKGKVMWVHQVYPEDSHNRPVRLQLHCKTRKK